MSRHNGSRSFIVGALLGSIAAGVTALLLAPKKGKEMRKELKKKYKEYNSETQDLVNDVSDRAMELVEKAKDIAHDAKDAAESFYRDIKRR